MSIKIYHFKQCMQTVANEIPFSKNKICGFFKFAAWTHTKVKKADRILFPGYNDPCVNTLTFMLYIYYIRRHAF